jgi:phage-related protein
MAANIRIAQFFRLTTSAGALHRFQNYFIAETKTFQGESYGFAPFQADGALASLNGENQQLRVLFPSLEVVIRLVEEGDGNRLSVLRLTTAWLSGSDQIVTTFNDFFIGIGATYNEETVELRFRSSMDSVGAAFPGRTLTSDNVGILPLNADLVLQ